MKTTCSLLLFISFLLLFSCDTPSETLQGRRKKDIKDTKKSLVCSPPSLLGVTTFEKVPGAPKYKITFTWKAVSNATQYQFRLRINNEQVVQTTTNAPSYTYVGMIPLYAMIKAQVRSVCMVNGNQVTSAPQTMMAKNYNAIGTDDIVFRATDEDSTTDICGGDCDYIFFEDESIINGDGSDLGINQVFPYNLVMYSYDYVKNNCLNCGTGMASAVDSAAFNQCLASDPNKVLRNEYTECN